MVENAVASPPGDAGLLWATGLCAEPPAAAAPSGDAGGRIATTCCCCCCCFCCCCSAGPAAVEDPDPRMADAAAPKADATPELPPRFSGDAGNSGGAGGCGCGRAPAVGADSRSLKQSGAESMCCGARGNAGGSEEGPSPDMRDDMPELRTLPVCASRTHGAGCCGRYVMEVHALMMGTSQQECQTVLILSMRIQPSALGLQAV